MLGNLSTNHPPEWYQIQKWLSLQIDQWGNFYRVIHNRWKKFMFYTFETNLPSRWGTIVNACSYWFNSSPLSFAHVPPNTATNHNKCRQAWYDTKNGKNYDPARSEIVHAKKLEQYNYWIDFPMDKITFLRSYKDL